MRKTNCILFSLYLWVSLSLAPTFASANDSAEPGATQLNISLSIHTITLKTSSEPSWSDGVGEFFFVRKIGDHEVRFPSNGYVNRKENETIEATNPGYQTSDFWHTNILAQNTNSLRVEVKGYEIDDSFNDILSPVSFVLDLTTFEFVEQYKKKTLQSGDFSILVDISCSPVVTSTSHPDTNQVYASGNIFLNWTTFMPGNGLMGHSYALDRYCCTIPDAVLEGTHNSVSFVHQPNGVYWFHIRSLDKAGFWSNTRHFRISIDNLSPVQFVNTKSSHFELQQNYPNPFNTGTSIPLLLKRSTALDIRIYNINGQLVRVMSHSTYHAGPHLIKWDGLDSAGMDVPSGVYVCHVSTDQNVQTIQMMIIR